MTLSLPAPQLRSAAPQTPPRGRTRTIGIPATAGPRAGAYLIDIAIVAIVATAVWLLTDSLVLVAVTVLELWAIGWVWEGHTGATPGNLICGIRTVQRDKDISVGARGLFLRSLVLGLSHIVPVLLPVGLSAAGVLDGLAKARVIDVRKTRLAAASGNFLAPDLEARVTGPDASEGLIAAAPGVISQTPLSPQPYTEQPPVVPEPEVLDAGSIPVFELSDGTVIEATGLGYIGRAPRAPETLPDAILVRVPDGTRSLSRTHAAFGVEDGQLWVQDLGSANGASIRHLGGSVTELVAHNPTFLVPGDVLVLGSDAELAFRRVAGRGGRSAATSQADAPSLRRLEPAVQPSPAVVDEVPPVVQSAPLVAQPAVPVAQPAVPVAQPASPIAQPAVAAAPQQPEPSIAPQTPPQQTPPQQAPLRRTEAAPRVAAPQAVVALQFLNGTTVPITGLGYIGRAPRLPEGEHPDAALIAVPDGDRSVSRTHGRFGIVDGQTWFEDLGSGNGSSLRTADGRSGPMTPHQRFGLMPGMTLQVGDCVIQVITL